MPFLLSLIETGISPGAALNQTVLNLFISLNSDLQQSGAIMPGYFRWTVNVALLQGNNSP
ncbi:MAG: hypothetical protein JNM68_09740 [Dinghuibacter sp.]|nr:hypothetical protein [Dinghuibacter sp.]